MKKQDLEKPSQQSEFESLEDAPQLSIVGEFKYFLRENKKWWLVPILLLLAGAGLLVLLGSTGVAPFIYTLF